MDSAPGDLRSKIYCTSILVHYSFGPTEHDWTEGRSVWGNRQAWPGFRVLFGRMCITHNCNMSGHWQVTVSNGGMRQGATSWKKQQFRPSFTSPTSLPLPPPLNLTLPHVSSSSTDNPESTILTASSKHRQECRRQRVPLFHLPNEKDQCSLAHPRPTLPHRDHDVQCDTSQPSPNPRTHSPSLPNGSPRASPTRFGTRWEAELPHRKRPVKMHPPGRRAS